MQNNFLHKNVQIWYQFGNSFVLFYENLQKSPISQTLTIFGMKNYISMTYCFLYG